MGETILGPRLRCIHCRQYDLCARCDLEHAGTGIHPLDHVFQVLEASECNLTVELPLGTRVVLYDGSSMDGSEATVVSGLGTPGSDYVLRFADGTERRASPSQLEPLITSDAEALRLIALRRDEQARRAAKAERAELEESVKCVLLQELEEDPLFRRLPEAERERRVSRVLEDAFAGKVGGSRQVPPQHR